MDIEKDNKNKAFGRLNQQISKDLFEKASQDRWRER